MNDQTIEQEIQTKGANVAPRITPEDIEANIVSEHYFTARDGRRGAIANSTYVGRENPQPGDADLTALDLLTFCVLVLRNGTRIVGTNYGAIDPARQDWQQGRQAAYDMAREKVWELEGYALRERLAAPVVSASFLLNDTPEQEADLLEKLRKAPSSGIFLTALDSDAGKAVAALLQAAEAMRAFTDPEGNMPADTGEFNDLKEALAVAEGVLAGNAQAMDGGPNPHYDREALAKALAPGLRPIDTAPTDGTVFLGYRERDGRWGECYRIQRDDCEMWGFGGESAAAEEWPNFKPTHWISLPGKQNQTCVAVVDPAVTGG